MGTPKEPRERQRLKSRKYDVRGPEHAAAFFRAAPPDLSPDEAYSRWVEKAGCLDSSYKVARETKQLPDSGFGPFRYEASLRANGIEYPECTVEGCDTHAEVNIRVFCWDHERERFPERVCHAPGCNERASDVKRGGRYCWEHDESHNPYWPYASKKDKAQSYSLLATIWIVLGSLGIWAVIFGFNWMSNPPSECAPEASSWTWTGPQCLVTDEELATAERHAREATYLLYSAQIDALADKEAADCLETALLVESDPRGRGTGSDVLFGCLLTSADDLEALAREMDSAIDAAWRKARDDLYLERTGRTYP